VPDLPEQHNASRRKPWQKSTRTPPRQAGRKLQRDNERIKRRDGYTCQQCGKVTAHLEVDHIIPLSEGGKDDDANKQSLCIEPCHAEKSKAERARAHAREASAK
jgi:5-methylcytosine-specific restriction protein A